MLRNVDHQGGRFSICFQGKADHCPATQQTSQLSITKVERQLGRLLGGRTMICLPLKADGKSAALMVYVPEEGQAAPLDRQMSTLLTLGTRAAEDLVALRASIS